MLGVTGSIAAYKAAELASKLTQLGAQVHVVMTEHACEFVAPLTFRSLTGNLPLVGLFDEPHEGGIAHIDVPTSSDLLLIAPATANIIGKLAHGIADDWLSTAALVVRCPVVIAPAMNCNMYTNRMVVENVERLKALGYEFVEPEAGRLACGTEGVGRLADVHEIIDRVVSILSGSEEGFVSGTSSRNTGNTGGGLLGMNLVVTAGPTREPIDAVRFLSNYSSGKMGYAIAEAGAARGASVTLISGPTSLAPPDGVAFIGVETAAQMRDAVAPAVEKADVFVSAAAVADFTPAKPAVNKIKKTKDSLTLELLPTDDILEGVGRSKDKQILVGFAAETDNAVENATSKVRSKNLDMIVVNEVFQEETVFGSDANTVAIVTSDGAVQRWPRMTKRQLADNILDFVQEHLWRNGI